MFRSISSQLQFSYGLLAVVALVGLGSFGYQHQKSEMLRKIDEGLQLRSKQISSMLVRREMGGLSIPKRSEEAEVIPEMPPLPGATESEHAEHSYKVWRTTEGAPQLIFQSSEPPKFNGQPPHPRDIPTTGIVTTHSKHRQNLSRAVRSYVILIDTDITNQKAQLFRFLTRMIAAEVAFFIVFILAGFWLTKKALYPIGEISETARTIGEGALDERISIKGGSSELTDLVAVLNESFDRLELSLLRQQKFTSNASHELRTPITAILAEGQSKPKTIDEYRSSLAHCVETARSMGQLVDQLLELTRFDSGKAELHRQITDLDILVNRSIQLVQPQANEKSIQIEHQLELVQSEVNSVGITQIMINLLNNAITYSDPDSQIQVRLIERESHIEISVTDTGVGISEEDLSIIFDRFYRGNQSRSDHGSHHFGLGLAISQEIAASHGGEILVQSELGKGAVFSLILPLSGPKLHP